MEETIVSLALTAGAWVAADFLPWDALTRGGQEGTALLDSQTCFTARRVLH